MANISQNVNIEILEKLPNGTYKRKYPKTRADDGTTFDEHLADYTQHIHYGIASGGNNKTITLDRAPSSYVDGMALSFKNTSKITGATTINVNGLGVKSILNSKGEQLGNEDLVANSVYTIRYNGTSFILQGEGGERFELSGEQVGTYEISEAIDKLDRVALEKGTYDNSLPSLSSPPPGRSNSVDFSPDGELMAVGHNNTPYISLYKRSGDTFTKLPNPSTLPGGTVEDVAFSPDGQHLAVAHWNYPYLSIYEVTGDTFTKLPNSNISHLPGGIGFSVTYSPVGKHFAIRMNGSPYVAVYSRDGNYYTRIATISNLGGARRVRYSSDGMRLVATAGASPYLHVVNRDGDDYSSRTSIHTGALPWQAQGASFSPDGQHLAVAHEMAPYLSIFKVDGNSFTKLPNPSILPTGYGIDALFSPEGNFLAVVSYGEPYLLVYRREGDSFTKIPNFSSLPTGSSDGVAFSTDGKYLTATSRESPYVVAYERSDNIVKARTMDTKDLVWLGYAKEKGAQGSTIEIGKLWEV